MKLISLHQILVYYDEPQVIEARDSIGGHYIGVAIDDKEYEFLIIGASPEKLRLFRGGSIDLLTLILDRPNDVGWQLANWQTGTKNQLELSELSLEEIKTHHLPESGFVLRASQSSPDLVKQAQEINGLVMEVTLDPPEAVDHRINSNTLGQFLIVFQRMLKHAYKVWLKGQSSEHYTSTGYTFAVAGIKPGSVILELQTGQAANLFGASESKTALIKILKLINSAADPEKLVQEIILNRGHVASAFISLLDVLVDNDTRLQVDWADGLSEVVKSASLSQNEAKIARSRLGSNSEFEGESVVYVGVLKKADVNRGAWSISAGKDVHSGLCTEGGQTLSGLVMESTYEFSCIERIELSPAGRESTTLHLNSFKLHQPF